MSAEKIKAVALDLDGTLLGPGAALSERSVTAVKACIRRGLKIIIATGRSIDASERFRAPLDARGPMIYFNGALVADMPGQKNFKTTLMDTAAASCCVDISRETGVYFQAFLPCEESRIKLVAEQSGPEREMYHKHTGILAETGDLMEELARPGLPGCIKGMFLAEPEVQTVLRAKLGERLGGSVYIAQTLRNFLEVMDAKVSKGEGLKTAMERLSLKKEEIIAFGDEENDLPMFSAAGFSAAPANARDSVRKAADIVIGLSADDGVAVFLEEFFGLR